MTTDARPYYKKKVTMYRYGLQAIMCLLFFQLANAQSYEPSDGILYVDQRVSAGGDGSSWGNAIPELADALRWVREQWGADGSTAAWTVTTPLKIYVAIGTYHPLYSADDGGYTSDGGQDNAFVLVPDVQMFGGFDPASGKTHLDNRVLPTYDNPGTILSGDFDENDLFSGFGETLSIDDNDENAFHVLIATSKIGQSTILDGFTVQGGNTSFFSMPLNAFDEQVDPESGGGMFNAGSPMIRNMLFRWNEVYRYGGAIYDIGGIHLSDVTIRENYAYNDGGGISIVDTEQPAKLDRVVVTGNNAWNGGGIDLFRAAPRLTNVLVAGNYAEGNGGGINNLEGEPILTNVTVSGNTIEGSFLSEGAEWYDDIGHPVIRNSIIWGNGVDGLNSIERSYSLIQGFNSTAGGNIRGDEDPTFADPGNGDYTLQAASPGYNKGSNTLYEAADGNNGNNSLSNDLDLAGNPRVYRYTDGGIIDIGAYEYSTQPITPTDGILYVNNGVDSHSDHSGSSWNNAMPELADALRWARKQWGADGSTAVWNATDPLKIFVAEGTYKPLYNTDDGLYETDGGRDNAFVLLPYVEIYGGFAGTEASADDRSATALAGVAHKTILSGDLDGDDHIDNFDNHTENTYHVVLALVPAVGSVLDGFTVSGGNANGGPDGPTVFGQPCARRYGGGLFNYSGGTIRNVSIVRNRAAMSDGFVPRGAGVYNNGNATYTRVTIAGNATDGQGGGMTTFGAPTLNEVTIRNNSAVDGAGMDVKGTPTLINTVISGNTLLGSGSDQAGGIYNDTNYDLRLINVTIGGNSGAAIRYGYGTMPGSRITLHNCIVWGGEVGVSVLSTITYSLIEGRNDAVNGNVDAANHTAATIFTNPAAGDYRLRRGSPAIDAGDNAAYEAADGDGGNNSLGSDTDMVGNPRVYGGTIDMGAYESTYVPVSPTGGVLYVDINVDVGKTGGVDALSNQSGDSWANAIPELADALKWAKENEGSWSSTNPLKIYVAKGIYKPKYSVRPGAGSVDEGRDNTFLLVPNVQLYGGFDPDGGITGLTDPRLLPDPRPEAPDIGTILSGDIDGSDQADGSNNGNNAYHVVVAVEVDHHTVLDGFTITGGNADDDGQIDVGPANLDRNKGGGMVYMYAAPTTIHLKIKKNRATVSGGGVAVVFADSNAEHVFRSAVICDNQTGQLGGGMYLYAGKARLIDVCLARNSAAAGGGIWSSAFVNDLWLINATVTGNTGIVNNTSGADAGGGIIIRNSIFTDLILGAIDGLSGGNNLFNEDVSTVFEDWANGDYRLKAISPAINAGNDTYYADAGGNPGTDVDAAGKPRLAGSGIDIGAFEYPITMGPDDNNILYVDKQVASRIGDGSSWATAMPELADALKWAQEQWDSGDPSWDAVTPLQIWVAGGTYLPRYHAATMSGDNPVDRHNTFRMVPDVQLYGGFVGGETSPEDRVFSPSALTVLSGDLAEDDNTDEPATRNENAYHVVVAVGLAGETLLDGFTISGGNANTGGTFNIGVSSNSYPVYYNRGSGIYGRENSASIKLTNLIIRDNTADDSGGGIYSENSPVLVLTNVLISGSSAGGYGGGMTIHNSGGTMSAELTNVTIAGNTAGTDGSGMFNQITGGTTTITFTNTIVWGNIGGSGIFDNVGPATLNLLWSHSLAQGMTVDDTNGNIAGVTDPYFVDPANGDYRLQPGSPAINGGDNSVFDAGAIPDLSYVTTDLGGQLRIQRGTVDLGAYESPYGVISPTGGILYVNAAVDAGKGPGDVLSDQSGSSWANAIPELRDALRWAEATKDRGLWGTTEPLQIWVAKGKYTPVQPVDPDNVTVAERAIAFQLVNNVEIYGGFTGGETERTDRDWKTNATILSGDIDGNDTALDGVITDPATQMQGANSRHVVIGSDTDGSAVLDGFTLTAALGEGALGGGIYNMDGSPTLANLDIRGNNALIGAGVFNHHSAPRLTNVIIRNNHAGANGGGVMNRFNSAPTFVNVLISDNTADQYGGGMHNQEEGTLTLTNVTITGNTAVSRGGGIYSEIFSPGSSSSYSFTNVIVWGNTASEGSNLFNSAQAGTLALSFDHSLFDPDEVSVGSSGFGTVLINEDDPSLVLGRDPDFVDPAAGDYRLRPGSPAIDAGSNAGYEAADGDDGNNSLGNDVDLASNLRVHSLAGTVDMGAYEYQPVEQIITVADIEKTYGDAPFEPGATADSGLPVSYTSGDNTIAEAFEDADDGHQWKIRILKAGEVTITASQAGNSDYLPADDQTFTLTIAKRVVEIGFADDALVTKEYDGTVEATVTAGQLAFAPGDVIDGDELTITLSDGAAAYDSGDADTDKPVTLPLARVSLAGAESDNYIIGNTQDITGTVGAVTPRELTVRTAAISKTYDGTTAATVIFEPFTAGDGLVGSDAVSVEFTGTAAYDSPGAGSNKPVTLSTAPTLAGAEAGNYTPVLPELLGEITPRPVTVSFAPDAEITKEYDGTSAATVTSQDLAFAAGEVVAGDALSVSLSSGAGSYADKHAGTGKAVTLPLDGITLAGADRDNYAVANTAPLTGDAGAITEKALTIKANNHTVLYSGTAYSGGNGVAYEGFVPGEDESVLSGTLTYGGSSQGAVDADTYLITPGGLTSSDYAITFADGTLVISGGAANILSFNVQQAGSAVARIYGGGDVDGSAVASSGLSVTYGSSDADVATVDANGQIRIKGVGTATLTASQGGNVNYAPAADISFTLEVQPKALTVTARSATKVYDGVPYSGGAGVDYSGFIPGEDPSVLSGTLTYGGTSQGATDAGSYAIVPWGLGAANYTITYTDGRLDIVPGGDNVLTFDSRTAGSTVDAVYGAEPLPAAARATSGLAVSYSSGDGTVATVSADGTVTIRGAGSTRITASQAGDANHDPAPDISFTLRVARKELTVTANNGSKTYDGAAYSGGNGVQYTGFVYGEDESVLGGTLTYGGSSQGATDVGSYGIVPGGYASPNYAITYRNGSLSVTKRPVTVSFAAGAEITKEYDGTSAATVTSQDLAFGAGEVIADDELSVNLSSGTGSYADKHAGTGKEVTLPLEGITLAGADRDNYSVANTAPVNGDVGAITKKALTITANNHTVLYTGTAYSGGNGVAYGGFVPGEDESVLGGTLTYGGSSQGAVDAGSYTIMPSGLLATDYAPEYRAGSLTVNPAMRTLSFPVLPAKIYGDDYFDAGARASSGEGITYTSSNPAVAVVTTDGTIRITGTGEAIITATVPENSNYSNKPALSHTLTVHKATQTITLDAPAEAHRDMGSVPVGASSDSGLPVTLTVDDPEVATLDGTTLLIHRLGTVRITATQAGDDNHEAADAVTVVVRITDPASDFPVRVSKAVSPNGDGINEYLVIEGIREYPDNRVSIFNRNGTVVYEASGYNNGTVAFRGIGTGQHRMPAGTYFYVAEIRVGGKWKYEKGWFVLRY